ncbi:chemotaxis protein CheC [Chengkuizengella axinellae]|uniref:Chemotaxis protein CheC n=1 Tax=Chengkuizengella axinellae TaxID=3064388 RepID=A0ABT9IW31_9BACL|nr:chemotaxis protein CheC [Chengkuizengella sp. 2205SS18-9]MDP5273463.1 chemotaxis protein CheC [Chengkuizengella sp. 2205SS18-9]
MSNINKFEPFQLDVLQEIGNIGSGNATTALSNLINKSVDMKVPKVNFGPFSAITESLGDAEKAVIAVYLRVVGETPGNMYFLLSQKSANQLLSDVLQMDLINKKEYSDIEISALTEIGNILAGSYLSSLANLTHLKIFPSVPSLSMDMLGAVLSSGMLQSGQYDDYALLIETNFLEGSENVEGNFIFIPDPGSLHKIFHSLGVPIHD